jgi:hypothetical protein
MMFVGALARHKIRALMPSWSGNFATTGHTHPCFISSFKSLTSQPDEPKDPSQHGTGLSPCSWQPSDVTS